VRFGNAFDTGYTYLIQTGFLKARFERYGIFHPVYIPFNFIYMFLQGFHVYFRAPSALAIAGMDHFGTSIIFASPFVLAAFWAKWKRNLLWGAWVSISLMLIHLLFHFNNGYLQINAQRFTLDFLPILILLVALGVQQMQKGLWKIMVAYSIALNIFALFCVPYLARIMRGF
jgi:hypothetical protein